jgi:hypothetical protein
MYAYFLCFLSLQKRTSLFAEMAKIKNRIFVSKTIDFSLISIKDKLISASEDSK